VESAVTIRRLAPSDADSILAIQSQCPELTQWSNRDYEGMADGGMVGWVASLSGDPSANEGKGAGPIIGFITARVAADEMEILNLAVAPDQRRRGAASALLRAATAWGLANEARRGFLEVRASNLAAIRFYEMAGFTETGRRTNYYASPVEDALQLVVRIR